MNMPLLATKFHIPALRPALVARPRLLARLDTSLHHKLILLSAPAGFGKTTLLGAWRAACGLPVAWFSLDAGDNDPARFLAYLAAALNVALADSWDTQSLSTGLEHDLTTFVNQISALPDHVILVLDDYHLITATAVHDIVTFLLDYAPANLHLIIATRADPPLPIARLRGRGQLLELRQSDLRFTQDETAELLNMMTGLDVATGDLATLISRTEGWIAGLQMAALSMRDKVDISAFIAAFAGSNRFILDYLLEEVLYREPPHIQDFLLKTSLLQRLSASLCDALIKGEATSHQSQEILETLEKSNLFIVPLDDRREWYRYHRLFSDLLQRRLKQTALASISELHHRASAWYERHNLMPDAIDHALLAEDFIRAADLVTRAAEATFMRSEVVTVLHWVDALPDDLVRVHPALCVYHAWALLLSGQPLRVVEARLRDIQGDADLVSSKTAPLWALIVLFQGQTVRARAFSERALETLPLDNTFLRDMARLSLAMTCTMSADLESGVQALKDAAATSERTGNVMISVMTLCHLAELQYAIGQMDIAQQTYERALCLTENVVFGQVQRLPVAGLVLIGLGELARERNALDAAIQYLTSGLDLIEQWGAIGAFDGYISLARAKLAQGEYVAAQQALELARDTALAFDMTDMDDRLVEIVQMRMMLMQYQTASHTPASAAQEAGFVRVLRWADQHQLTGEIDPAKLQDDYDLSVHLRRRELLLMVRVYLIQQRPDLALALLDVLSPLLARRGSIRRKVEVLLLKALAYQARGDETQAFSALVRAFDCVRPCDYIRVFLDEGEALVALVRHVLSKGGLSDGRCEFARNLLHHAGGGSQHEHAMQPTQLDNLLDPLSDRELEVLRLLPSGRSATEIAETLFISVHTVRSHLKNIYGKLNVHSRYEAVARARDYDLI